MSVEVTHPVVAAYLAQLDAAAAAAGLGGGRRAELRAEIAAHVDDALAGLPQGSDAAVAEVLDRLGRVEDIVAAEPGSRPVPPPGPLAPPPLPVGGTRWGPTEWIALALLTVGAAVLPVIGPIAGAVVAWSSRVWSRSAKILATVAAGLAVLVLLLAALLFLAGATSVATSEPVPAVPFPVPVPSAVPSPTASAVPVPSPAATVP